MAKRVAILGSTGSIGSQTLDVLDESSGFSVCGLGAGRNWETLADQAKQYSPAVVAIADPQAESQLAGQLPAGTELLTGPEAMCELVRKSAPDIVVSAVVGAAGLAPTLAAIETGATIALANKETLVCAGQIVMPAAHAAGVDLLPVDSEHAGIFQCMMSGKRSEVRRVIITSSGGALRDWSDEQAATATAADALNHPTWEMGRKITIDSATLMNKVLEVIEAHWLFDLSPEQIEVVIHPQSIIHALVEFCDGSVMAQLAKPDMKLPIAYALQYPDRPARNVAPLNLADIGSLTFKPVTGRNARAVNLAYEIIRHGGACGAVLNAANEAAVEAFLTGRIKFGKIVDFVETTLKKWLDEHSHARKKADFSEESVTLPDLLAADAWARQQVLALMPQ